MFHEVQHTREQLHDAEVLRTLAKQVCTNSTKLSNHQTSYDFDTFATSLKLKFHNSVGQFNWNALGNI